MGTLLGLISANNDRKSEIDALRGDHEELKKNHEAFVVTAERENDLRKNEIKSLEERTLRTAPGSRRSPTWTAGPRVRTIPARPRSQTSTTSQSRKMTPGSRISQTSTQGWRRRTLR